MIMKDPTEEELKEWQENPVTKAVISKLKTDRQDELESALHDYKDSTSRPLALDRVLGMDKFLHILENIKEAL